MAATDSTVKMYKDGRVINVTEVRNDPVLGDRIGARIAQGWSLEDPNAPKKKTAKIVPQAPKVEMPEVEPLEVSPDDEDEDGDTPDSVDASSPKINRPKLKKRNR